MADSKVSYRYASSLLGLAVEKKILDAVSTDVEMVRSAIEDNAMLRNLLKSPIIKPQSKASILDEILSKAHPETKKFVRFVVDKNRENFLLGIASAFLGLRDEYIGFVNVSIKTAYEFNDEQKKRLKEKLESLLNKKVGFSFEIDKSLVGGFIAQVNDTVYDASLKHQLDLLRTQLLEGGIYTGQTN
ncbi:MAG TPA: ATP synthase F1 subunit delta [Ignavibacteriaceae bacterium]|nr:ATP synthase F1 subunit delta [Ignavibacteriaceae bacterium]